MKQSSPKLAHIPISQTSTFGPTCKAKSLIGEDGRRIFVVPARSMRRCAPDRKKFFSPRRCLPFLCTGPPIGPISCHHAAPSLPVNHAASTDPLATRLPPTSPPPSPTLASRPPLHPHAAAAAPSPAASPSRAANPRRPRRSAPSLLLLRSARMLLRPRAPHRRATPLAPRTLASLATEPLLGPRLKPGDGRRIQQQCWWWPPWRRRRPGGGRHKWQGWWQRSSGLPRDGGGAPAGAARGMVPRRRDQVVGTLAARPRGTPRRRPHAPDLALPQWPAAWIRFLPGRLGSMASMAGEVLLSHLRPAAGARVLLHPPAPVLLRARIWAPALLLSLEAGAVVPIHAAVP